MQYFFSTDILDDKIILSKLESRHCIGVLRCKEGDIINIVDGLGNHFECQITSANKSRVETKIVKTILSNIKNKSYIHIIIAPTKSSQRIEWFVEKAIEIGVDEISFISCANSERKKINLDRINKIAITAMKQSLKSILPKINDLKKIKTVLNNISQSSKYIGYLGDSKSKFLSELASKDDSYCLLIGPEGDFTQVEFEYALEKGFVSMSLGNSRLRTETAGISGCLILNNINYE